MRVLLSILFMSAFTSIASASNHVNIEGSGCLPDRYSLPYLRQSTSGLNTLTTPPAGGLFRAYCPVNYIDGQNIAIIRQTIFGTTGSGSAVISTLYRLNSTTGVITAVGSVACGATSSVTTCSAGMNYTPNPATDTLWIDVEFSVYGGASAVETLVNVQLD